MPDDRMRSSEPQGSDLGGEPSIDVAGGASRATARGLLEGLVPPLVHKLNNAIGGVAGLSDLISRAPASPQSSQYAGAIGEQARVALDLLATLADVSRPATGELEPTDLAELARRAERFLAPLAEARATELVVRAPSSAAVVPACASELLREVVEAVASALVPLPREGGSLRRGRLTVEDSPGSRRLRLILRADSAVPTPADTDTRRIRSRGPWLRAVWSFETGSASSRGAISGGVSALTPVASGAKPQAAKPSPSPSMNSAPTMASASELGSAGAGSAILLCESDPQLADLLATVLTEAGHRVRAVSDLDRIEEQAADFDCDLVLLESAADGLGSGPSPARVEALAAGLRAAGRTVGLLGSPSPPGLPHLNRPFRPGELLDFASRAVRGEAGRVS